MNKTKDSIFSFTRAGGLLVHPTSLPGDYGIGDLGTNAYKFIDFLKKNKLHVWQILPFGPTGYGNSPYQCFSAFAGNPYLISIDQLVKDYKLTKSVDKPDVKDKHTVDFEKVISFKMKFLKEFYTDSFERLDFQNNTDYISFKKEEGSWLNEYALFMSIKSSFNQKSWLEWDKEFKLHNLQTLKQWSLEHEKEIEYQKFVQFLFFSQWKELKAYAVENDITIVGDIPIYVALDSADVWSNQHLFLLENGNPTVIAGVPPDFFSKTGQLWGNPIYNWSLMKKNKFSWWIKRISQTLKLVDVIRLDHFRGFEAYWEVPGKDKTAENGKWTKAPGDELFKTLKKKFNPLPLIAEDLGVITPEVIALRDKYSFPGMKILQMAFGDHAFVEKRFLPHNLTKGSVMYTGTHDNEPILAWWYGCPDKVKKMILDYLHASEETIVSDFIRTVWSTVSQLAVIPLQDLLRKGNESRMNFPGTLSHNWEWRFTWDEITDEYLEELNSFTKIYERDS